MVTYETEYVTVEFGRSAHTFTVRRWESSLDSARGHADSRCCYETPCVVFGVPLGCSEDAIKAQYRQLYGVYK